MKTWRSYLLVALACSGLVLAYFHFKPEPAPTGIHMTAKVAPEIAREETVPIIIDFPVQVYAPKVKQKLKLPESVQSNADKHVVASTKTPNDERSHTVTTLLDTSTGKFETYDRADPLPWVAVSTKSEVGMFYGYKDGEPTVRIHGQQELLQIKAVRLGAMASVDMTNGHTDTFVGVGAWARW